MASSPPAPRRVSYLLAVALVALVLAVRLLLDRGGIADLVPLPAFLLPTILAAWRGGLGPGLLAAALATAAAAFTLSDEWASPLHAIVSLSILAILGVLIAWLGEAHLTQLRHLESSRAVLEQRVAERTAQFTEAIDHLSREVSEHQVDSAALRELNARLEISNRELQDFASVASHDLQEPLRKIQAFGDRLEQTYGGALGEHGRDYLRRMRNAAGRMQTLINDLLAFSRVTTRGQPFTPTDLNQVTSEVLGDLETRIEEKAAEVEVGPLPALDADPMQVRQLLQNLLSNALKFSRDDVPPRIRVWAESDEASRTAAIHVQDNGIGFDEKYLDRIFNVFQRLHGRGSYEGTGIGLAICRRIAERHMGHLTARSRPGEGSTFIITLPLNHPHPQGIEVHHEHQADHHLVG